MELVELINGWLAIAGVRCWDAWDLVNWVYVKGLGQPKELEAWKLFGLGLGIVHLRARDLLGRRWGLRSSEPKKAWILGIGGCRLSCRKILGEGQCGSEEARPGRWLSEPRMRRAADHDRKCSGKGAGQNAKERGWEESWRKARKQGKKGDCSAKRGNGVEKKARIEGRRLLPHSERELNNWVKTV